MVRAILFDLGNVLLYFDHQRMCRQIAELFGCSGWQVQELLFDGGLLYQYELGQVTTDQAHGELQRALGRSVEREALLEAVSDIFWRNEPIEPVIDGLLGVGIPLVMVSNTCEAHMQWVQERFDIVARFSKRALSYEVGSAKPDPEIFQRAVALAGVPAHECFFTDDISENVAAARELGLEAERFVDTNTLLGDLAKRGIRPTSGQ